MRLSQNIITAMMSIAREEVPTALIQGFYVADKAVRKHFDATFIWEELRWRQIRGLSVFTGTVAEKSGWCRVRVIIQHGLPGGVRVETAGAEDKHYSRKSETTLIGLFR